MSQFAILDDDTQTFEGTPIKRFFKMRKWAVLFSLLLILLSQNWLDFESLKTSLKLSQLPLLVFHKSVWFSAVYLLVQSLFLIAQVATGYKDSLQNRALLSIKGQIDQLHEVIQKLRNNYKEMEVQLRKDIRELENDYGNINFGQTPETHPGYEELESLNVQIKRREEDKNELLLGKNLKRKIIYFTELSLDMMRVLPTVMLLLFAITFQSPF